MPLARLAPLALLATLALLTHTCLFDGAEEAVAPLGQTPLPDVVIDAGLDPSLGQRLRDVAAQLGFGVSQRVALAGSTSGSAIVVSPQPLPGGVETPVRFWVALTGFWSEAESFDLARPAFDVVFLPEEHRAGLQRLLGPTAAAPSARWLPLAEVEAAVLSTADSAALLPLERVGPRLRSLAVSGVDLLRGDDPAASSLVEHVWVGSSDPALAESAAQLAAELGVQAPPVVRLLATGDIIPARCVYARQRARGDYAAALRPLAPFLSAADLTVGSLDASLSDAAQPIGCEQTFNLMAPARSVEGLALAGFDAMSVATNHVKDCGSAGFVCGERSFLDTLANLRAAGIEPVGGGLTYEEAHSSVVMERKGVRFAFLAFDDVASSYLGAGPSTPGTAAASAAAVAEAVTRARREADAVIVLMQWGVEYEAVPVQRQRELARAAVQAGADLVIGNHPHVVQGVEWQGGALIAYALGNFVFDQDWSLPTQQGLVLEASFVGGRLAGVRLLPVRIVDMFQPVWAPPSEAREVLHRVQQASGR